MIQTNGRTSARRTAVTAREVIDPEMRHLGVGIDTARYGHHVSILREDKQPACPALQIMETRAGYDQLQQRLEQLHHRFPNAHIHLRIDAAGQYAANLERFVRSLTHLPLTVSVGEPKRNKDYHRAHSPKRKSDSTESHAMARYAVVERPAASYGKPIEFAALRRVASRLEAQTKQTTRLTNQLHETLAGSFPELATFISDLTAGWVLQLLEKYPTTERLAAARLSSLQTIPFLPKGMAETLKNAAKTSIGTLNGDVAEALIAELVSELRHSLAEEKRWRELLRTAFDSLPDGPHRQIATINGIGPQTAAALVATAVDIKRFETAKHFVGYYGVFPEELQSGVDKFGQPIPAGKKIMCRKGNDLVRGLLWQCAKCASAANGGNPAVRALYARRLAAGDSPQVAWGYCMTKLLRQVFGIWTSGQPFDPQHESKSTSETQTASKEGDSEQTGSKEGDSESKSETEASGSRDESQPTRGFDEAVTEPPFLLWNPCRRSPRNPPRLLLWNPCPRKRASRPAAARLIMPRCGTKSQSKPCWNRSAPSRSREPPIAAPVRSTNPPPPPAASSRPISSVKSSAASTPLAEPKATSWISGKPTGNCRCTRPPKTSPKPSASSCRS